MSRSVNDLQVYVSRRPSLPQEAASPQPWSQILFWLAAFGLTVAFTGPSFIASLRPPHDKIMDFFQEWASAKNLFTGRPIYEKQRTTMEAYLHYKAGENDRQIVRNAHPPTSVLLAIPLANLDYSDAFLAWSLTSLAALAVSLWLVIRNLGIAFRVWWLLPIVTLLLLCNPFRQQMIQGQLNLILLLLLTGVWVADRNGKPLSAGALLGAATAIKLFPGLFFLYFLLRREWRTVAMGIVSFMLLTAFTAVVLGPAAYVSYVRDAMPEVAQYYDGWPNISLAGFWFKVLDGHVGRALRVDVPWRNPLLAKGVIVASWLVVLYFLVRAILRARSREEHDRTFGLTLLAMLLVSPITWDHYCLLLLLPLAILWLRLPKWSEERVLFWICVVALWLTPMVYWAAVIPGANIQNWYSLVAKPWQAATTMAIPTYALATLFILSLKLPRPVAEKP